MSNYFELLKAAKIGGNLPSYYETLLARKLPFSKFAWTETTITGTPPLSFRAKGTALTAYSITGNMVQASGTTNVPASNVTVVGIESGTNYAEFALSDFPNAAVGDTITISVGGTNYSQKVKKIDSNYVYIENRTV